MAPFSYGRWDAVAQAHWAGQKKQTNKDAARRYNADGAFEPESARAAPATFSRPVLLLAGELDLVTVPAVAAEYAALFSRARLVVQPGASHVPMA
jgi:proline iminopeptidase